MSGNRREAQRDEAEENKTETDDEFDIPPVGSGCCGNISPPHIDHAAAAVTMPVKAVDSQRLFFFSGVICGIGTQECIL
jgi:hypothetical protein